MTCVPPSSSRGGGSDVVPFPGSGTRSAMAGIKGVWGGSGCSPQASGEAG